MCIFIFKILKNILPEQLRNRLEIVENESEKQTRQAWDIAIQYHRTRSVQKSIFYKGVKIYNALPAVIKRNEIIEPFKRILKEYVVINVK